MTKKLKALFFCFSFCLLTVLIQVKVFAQKPQTQNCGNGQGSYSALYQMETDKYDLYVRLGVVNQTAKVNLYFQSFETGKCSKLSNLQSTGARWQRISSFNAAGKNTFGTFILASPDFTDLPNANRPTLMLVSKTNPVCQPSTECYVKVNGQRGVLHAAGTLLNEDSLHVVTAKDPDKDQVSSADYFVDNRLVYSTKNIEKFDRRWVGGGQHTIYTVVTFKSKQQVVISQKVNGDSVDDLNYILFTFYNRYKFLIIITGLILGLLLVSYCGLLVARKIYKRRHWEKTHILHEAIEAHKDAQKSSLLSKWLKINQSTVVLVKPFAIFGSVFVSLIVFIALINTWFLHPYEVDGPSMNSTLKTGEQILVNKFGKTWSGLLGNKYVPKRGEIVVFTKAANVLFEPINPGQPTYIVKRVIGLPGERIVVRKGVITVYNNARPKGFNPDKNSSWQKNLHFSKYDRIDINLQPDEIFVVGDNRPESVDSRANGPIKLDEIIGNAVIRILPPQKLKLL